MNDLLIKKNPGQAKVWLGDCPAGRFCKVWELKGVYVFLASMASSYVTGSDYKVDGEFGRWGGYGGRLTRCRGTYVPLDWGGICAYVLKTVSIGWSLFRYYTILFEGSMCMFRGLRAKGLNLGLALGPT